MRRTMGVRPVDSESSSASTSCRLLTARPEERCKCVLLPLRTVTVLFVILCFQVRRDVRGVVGGVGGDVSLSRVYVTAPKFLIAALPTPEIRRTVPVPVPVRRVRLSAIGMLRSSRS